MGDCICVRRGDGPEGCGICNETGTTPDIAGLCERLRAPHGGAWRKEAADTLERQAAEIERLREALQSLIDSLAEGFISETRIDAARAALTGEDT